MPFFICVERSPADEKGINLLDIRNPSYSKMSGLQHFNAGRYDCMRKIKVTVGPLVVRISGHYAKRVEIPSRGSIQ